MLQLRILEREKRDKRERYIMSELIYKHLVLYSYKLLLAAAEKIQDHSFVKFFCLLFMGTIVV